MSSAHGEDASQTTFQKLKVTCVPLLSHSLLTSESISAVSKLLANLVVTLREAQTSGHPLTISMVTYVFFPLSAILRRNSLPSISDSILEKILIVLGILCERWWWDFDETTWEQIFMLCSAIIGDIDGKGKSKARADDTKQAAVQCLWALLRERKPEEDPVDSSQPHRATRNFSRFQSHAQMANFTPILGQTVNSLLTTAESDQLSLQRLSLKTLHSLVEHYLPDAFLPSILPGTVSSMNKIALGIGVSKGWANGEIVAASLAVMQGVIVRSVGDETCISEGAVRDIHDLEDLTDLLAEPKAKKAPKTNRPYSVPRTSVWLRGTASQLHIAMNSLTPLVNHPTPSALAALATFSESVLAATILTVPQSHPLLLSFLLSLTGSTFDDVSKQASRALRRLLTAPSSARHKLLQVLVQISKDNLSALPRLIPSHSDAKVEHVAGLIQGVCRLTSTDEGTQEPGILAISAGVGKLLGPNGGIEKWGWSLLSVLELSSAPITVTHTSAAQLMLETDTAASDWLPFPELMFVHVVSLSARTALERMFRSLGSAAGEDCLFAAEWFISVGENGRGGRAVAALWCACRLLEGIAGVSLEVQSLSTALVLKKSRRLEKLARGFARRVAELWMDTGEGNGAEDDLGKESDESDVLVEHRKGLVNICATVGARASPVVKSPSPTAQLHLHKALLLQLLSVSAGILEARFTPLLLHTLYPILDSIVSASSLVSDSGLAALNFITSSTSFASPANLLLSNFDYALDAVTHRLTRRWLDVNATKVLALLVRLVGRNVVKKAGDVVEECFDRLDEFHGYEVIVDGLMEVLGEVVKAIEDDEENHRPPDMRFKVADRPTKDSEKFESALEWLTSRHTQPGDAEDSTHDSAFPREAWGAKNSDENEEQQAGSHEPDINAEPPPSPPQVLTKQIVSRSLYFLTHGSPLIRARILTLLSSSVPILPESALLPSIHHAWPFILNRFSDPEPFVVSAAASLVESLASHVGDFMHRRIWDDVWPRFRAMLKRLDAADATNALARRGSGAVGTESAYTYSHRLYRSLLKTMTAAMTGVQAQDSAMWEVIVMFRRFLHSQAHEELQTCARELYTAIGLNNEDAVWMALSATQGQISASVAWLEETKWDIGKNVALIVTHS
ncbi:armadillo-type protein [Amylocystis lapponica]|nr:armadillo-type protein [Amylocystis lapponica]